MSDSNYGLPEERATTIRARARIDQARLLIAQLGEDANIIEIANNVGGCLDHADLLSKLLDQHREQDLESWRKAEVEGLTAEEVYQRLLQIIDNLVLLQSGRSGNSARVRQSLSQL